MQNGYRLPARILHWGLALAIIVMLPVGGIMVGDGLDRATQNALFILHKNLGVVILLLMVIRLAYRALNPPAPLPAHMPGWQKQAAGATHILLYVMVFFMAITGYVRVTMGGFPIEGLGAIGLHPLLPRNEAIAEIAKSAHFYGRFILLAVLALHIGAALHHALILRDGVFGRIWPFWRA
ncbi:MULTISPECIES: cytochrome b [unclassified Yoonia]|uniref:cytochrome b n=1 Tax=unclassified Yoonia TaxID=2629118 RepID=UPI002AFFCB9C|nr:MULTISPECIES: cytochrome b [unclassified Yoonia]